MKIVFGLGNPGKEYENTRHNVGFMTLDYISQMLNTPFNSEKFNGKYFEALINGEKFLFVKPQKYMNLSGEVVRDFFNYYKLSVNDILIINDDLDLPLGKIRIKSHGSAGGHNGLKNIEQNINSQEYKRIKVGISHNKKIDTKDYVLGHFSSEDKVILNDSIKKIFNIVKELNINSIEKIMSKYN